MPHTISEPVQFSGIGLHSGEVSSVSVRSSQKEGIYFSTENGLFPLKSAHVEENNRLTGSRLPDGTEVPILDGSPYPFALALFGAGIVEFGEAKKRIIHTPIAVDDIKGDRSVMALPSERLKITYVIDYPGTPVGTQRASYVITPEVFLERISKARTFGLTSELEYLKKNGLAKGGSLKNALMFDEKGLLNEGGLRFPLECVTHKINDLLGDLSLLGAIPAAHYIGICAGHDLHGRLVDRIKRAL